MVNHENLSVLFEALHAGDSLGSTSEFVSPTFMQRVYERERGKGWPFEQVGGGTFGWNPGEPTDDTSMASAIVRGVEKAGEFDGGSILAEFLAWKATEPRDIGGLTSRALSLASRDKPWYAGGLEAYRQTPNSAGNGALMRNGIIPAYIECDDDLFDFTFIHTVITHAHPMCVMISAFHAWIMKELILQRWPLDNEDWFTDFIEAWVEWFDETELEVVHAWDDAVTDSEYEAAVEQFADAAWLPGEFDPWQEDIMPKQGWSLLTMEIAVWTLWVCAEVLDPPLPSWFDERLQRLQNMERLCWVPLIGGDTDSYGAAAFPLAFSWGQCLPFDVGHGLTGMPQ